MKFFSKRIITLIFVVVIIVAGVLWAITFKTSPEPLPEVIEEGIEPKQEIIGKSVEGRKIESYTFGNGADRLLFVGGVHGGYEWNSVVLAYKFIDYLKANPEVITDNLTVAVIPSLNPDGVFKIISKEGRFAIADVKVEKEETKSGRFNANGVDLNRNFDCKWKPESMWQGNVVSAGTKPFSEPESKALRDFILKNKPVAAIFWHSQSNAVYASECEKGILPETREIMNTYSKVSGYPAVDSFDHYEITGDVEGWLASINIPAITVELKTHETIEWDRNLLGIKALFDYYK